MYHLVAFISRHSMVQTAALRKDRLLFTASTRAYRYENSVSETSAALSKFLALPSVSSHTEGFNFSASTV